MQAVILAGGLGERLRPITEIIPKPLLPIGEASILEIIIGNLVEYGFSQVFIATNYRSELIESYIGTGKKYGLKINFSREKIPLGTAGPLGLLKKNLNKTFVLTNGDIITNLDFKKLIDWHNSHKFDFTVVTKAFQTPLSYGVIECRDHKVVDIKEKPVMESIINAGIYCIEPKCLELVPENLFLDMNTFIRKLIKSKFDVGQYRNDSYWFDIGQFQDYERAKLWHNEGKLKINTIHEKN